MSLNTAAYVLVALRNHLSRNVTRIPVHIFWKNWKKSFGRTLLSVPAGVIAHSCPPIRVFSVTYTLIIASHVGSIRQLKNNEKKNLMNRSKTWKRKI